MFGFQSNGIIISYNGNIFTVLCENGETRTCTNGAEARNLFLGEVERIMCQAINDKLRDEGFNVHLGVKENLK